MIKITNFDDMSYPMFLAAFSLSGEWSGTLNENIEHNKMLDFGGAKQLLDNFFKTAAKPEDLTSEEFDAILNFLYPVELGYVTERFSGKVQTWYDTEDE